MIDRQKLMDGLRSRPFPGHLDQTQVQGMMELLDVWESVGYQNVWFPAVNLANVFHETGQKMVPVREGFAATDIQARRIVARAGRKYAKEVNGHVYYGRGRIQNTWDYNYEALSKRFDVDLLNNPDLLIDNTALDAQVTVHGHLEGIWTGGKQTLAKYLADMPHGIKLVLGEDSVAKKANALLVGSRRCVNGTDKAQLIAGYAKMIALDLLNAGA